MKRDISTLITIEQSILPAVIATDDTTNGTAVDTRGYNGATVVFTAGTLTDGTYALTVQDSADGTTGWEDIDTTEQIGTLDDFDSTIDERSHWVGVAAPRRRYLRAVITSTSTTAGGIVAAAVVLSGPGSA